MSEGSRPMGTVERAIVVLHVLADANGDLGTNEIARRTGVNPSTVSRLLATLANDELVSREPDTGRFRLGPRLVELGNAALTRIDLRQMSRPRLEALTETTGETATLSVPYQQGTITVDFVQSPSSVRSVAQVGRPSVAHATATGKVFLAYAGVSPDVPMPPFTGHTLTDPAELRAQIHQIRRRGWALAVGEREEDLNAVAAPVLGTADVLVGVLGVQGPAGRFGPKVMRGAAEVLVGHCAELSASLR